jgi:hypothetical protein
MAIPNKPLVITGEDGQPFDFEELYLEESALFEPNGFSRRGVVKFLQGHSNWTRAEIARIKEKELLEVWKQLTDKVNAATVPLVK